jgi:hypothetical protein
MGPIFFKYHLTVVDTESDSSHNEAVEQNHARQDS